MSEIQRYDLHVVNRYAGDGSGEIETDATIRAKTNGRYVSFDDHQIELAYIKQQNLDLQKRWDSTNSALQRRNMLNDRMQDRIDELKSLLRGAFPAVKYESNRGDDVGSTYQALAGRIDAILNNTKSEEIE